MQRYEVPQAAPTSYTAINHVANQLLMRRCPEALQGTGSFDPLRYVEFHLVDETETDYHVSTALPPGTWAETRFKLMTISEETYWDAHAGGGFARFTIAHEIGHVYLHQDLLMKRFHSSQQGNELFTRDQLEPYCDPEWQADEFAASLLMPTSGMTHLRQRYVERATYVNAVMSVFKVSFAAANYRTDKLIRRGKLRF